MRITSITYNNSSCKYHSHHNWIIETTSNDYNEVLEFCKKHFQQKKRSHEEYLQAKETVDPKLAEGMMAIDGDGFYNLYLLNDGKRDEWGYYKWEYITHAENIY